MDLTPYCSSSAMDAQAQLLTDISEALQAMGVDVEQVGAGWWCGAVRCALR